ncbi:MAG: ATP-binding protein, partial [Myxococcota bacterium]
DIFPLETAKSLREVDQRVLSGQTVQDWTGDVSTHTGQTRQIFDIKFPVQDLEGDEVLIGGFAVDLTAQYEARQKLQAMQRLESLGLLAGGIAHDFNNLLVGIMGNAEVARAEASGTALRHVDAVIETSKRAAQLCQQLLAYAGKSVAQRRAISPSQFLTNITDLLTMSARGRCRVDVVATATSAVLVDPAQLQQILLNLVLNAAEASESPSCTVTVSSHDAQVPLPSTYNALHSWLPEEEKSCVRLQVEDDGSGMDEETVRQVFEPFYSTKTRGHGLGLAAVLGIVKRSEGAIAVWSSPGRGTRFDLFLPTTSEEPMRDSAVDVVETHEKSASILVIDDESMVADVAAAMLERAGFSVTVMTDSRSGIEELDHNVHDLVVLDVTMPDLNGLEALKRIRSRFPLLPVILSSGYSKQNIEGALDNDVGFLRKPFTTAELYRLVYRMLDRADHHSGK